MGTVNDIIARHEAGELSEQELVEQLSAFNYRTETDGQIPDQPDDLNSPEGVEWYNAVEESMAGGEDTFDDVRRAKNQKRISLVAFLEIRTAVMGG